jgi:hypothetical protein
LIFCSFLCSSAAIARAERRRDDPDAVYDLSEAAAGVAPQAYVGLWREGPHLTALARRAAVTPRPTAPSSASAATWSQCAAPSDDADRAAVARIAAEAHPSRASAAVATTRTARDALAAASAAWPRR